MATVSGKGATFLLAAAWVLGAAGPSAAQKVRIDRCTPSTFRSGETVEITLAGGGLEGVELWTSFPAKIERADEKAPRFRLTANFVGVGAIRAHSNEGVSNLTFVEVGSEERPVISCEKRTHREDAQKISVPSMVDGSSANLAAHYYQFAAKGGQPLVVQAEARGSGFDGVITVRAANNGKRLAQADDSEIHGADPWLRFIPAEDGDYQIELSDSQYRGGQAYRLTLGPARPPVLAPPRSGLIIHREGDEEPRRVSHWQNVIEKTIQGGFEQRGDVDVFSFSVLHRTFLTITPTTRSLHSPVTPRLKLSNAEKQILAETPHDTFEEQPLRLWVDKGDNYLLTISDAFGRHGKDCNYRLELDGEAIPFELTVPGQREKKHPLHDKFLAVPGGIFVVPVQCQRHQFTGPIDLCVDSAGPSPAANGLIGENQGNLDLRLRMPKDAALSTLQTFWLTGTTKAGGKSYLQPLRTRAVLQERDPAAAIPEEVDGALAVRVIECPVTVEVTPPPETTRGVSTTVPVKLVWRDEKRKFNTTLNLAGLPSGVHTAEKKLNNKDTTTSLELKVENPGATELKNLRVEVRLDYHQQALLVESEPFTIRITENDEKRD